MGRSHGRALDSYHVVTKPLNICILGCGKVAVTHSRVARTLRSELRLSYASRSLEKAQEYNRRFGGVGAYGSYEAACAAREVDAVFICTPHALHVDHVRLAATNNKPMLIEKPVARSLDELSQIQEAVHTHRVPTMVAENYFFKPVIGVLRKHMEAGDIGDVIFIELNKTGQSNNTGWRTDDRMMGGGALLEGGCHWVNLLLELAGAPCSVIATKPTTTSTPRAPFEDNLEMLVKFQSGAVGKLLHSWNTLNRIGGLSASKIYGTAGNITFESNGLWAVVLGKRKRFRLPGLLDIMGYRGMLRAFARCLRDGTPPPMSLDVAARDLAFIFAAYQSLQSNRFETIHAPGTNQPQT